MSRRTFSPVADGDKDRAGGLSSLSTSGLPGLSSSSSMFPCVEEADDSSLRQHRRLRPLQASQPCGHACMHGRCATRASLRTRGDSYSLEITIVAFSSAVCRSGASFVCRSATWYAVCEVCASPAHSAGTAGRGLRANVTKRHHGCFHISIGSLHMRAVRAQRAWHRAWHVARQVAASGRTQPRGGARDLHINISIDHVDVCDRLAWLRKRGQELGHLSLLATAVSVRGYASRLQSVGDNACARALDCDCVYVMRDVPYQNRISILCGYRHSS
jgi:hypothetical protein